ncbi:uncharacterized protein CCHa1 isoform X2 [Linepithema humile]|uniref:uncharacterized protein CCHa1 isoform X2 n=1 Tax=Linepithema humile TaxID=83485 RepID=UPI000623A6A4|nr:PREDICTED: uncharacterized protein LOC105675026 [Linepithema humile]
MAFTLRNPRVVQTYTIVSIFCFIGSFCTAGACMGYGSSCWGAHGKRSDMQDVPVIRILAAKTLLSESPQKAQWILSRLMTRQPVLPFTDKYHVRWSGFSKDKTYVSPKWDRYTAPMNDETFESIRIPINNENENDERKASIIQSAMRKRNEKFENTPEILLVSSNEYDKLINDPYKLDVLKFLNEGNGKAE